MSAARANGKRALITGATGSLGGSLARRLAREGWDVTGTGRDRQAGAALERKSVRFAAADLTDAAAISDLCAGQDIVVHSAALSSPWGTREAFHAINVGGTGNVVQGCRRHGVLLLVHVSTPSIYHDGTDRFAIREDAPLPRRASNDYAATKRIAEDVVRAADDVESIILRPRGIFGPGDQTLLPRLIRALRGGRLPVLGSGDNVCDLTYIDNAVDALALAMQAPAEACGRAYNITNGEPVRLWDVVGRLCDGLDLPRPTRRVPLRGALLAAGALELVYRTLPPLRDREPIVTRYSVSLLATSMTLDISAATKHLGYTPAVSMDEGVDRYVEHYRRTEGRA